MDFLIDLNFVRGFEAGEGGEAYEPEIDFETIVTNGVGIHNEEPNNIPIHNNYLNIYEITLLVGYRAQQISMGANSFLKDEEAQALCNPLLIAEEEFKRGLIPFDIIRHIHVGNTVRDVPLVLGRDIKFLDAGNMI